MFEGYTDTSVYNKLPETDKAVVNTMLQLLNGRTYEQSLVLCQALEDLVKSSAVVNAPLPDQSLNN